MSRIGLSCFYRANSRAASIGLPAETTTAPQDLRLKRTLQAQRRHVLVARSVGPALRQIFVRRVLHPSQERGPSGLNWEHQLLGRLVIQRNIENALDDNFIQFPSTTGGPWVRGEGGTLPFHHGSGV